MDIFSALLRSWESLKVGEPLRLGLNEDKKDAKEGSVHSLLRGTSNSTDTFQITRDGQTDGWTYMTS